MKITSIPTEKKVMVLSVMMMMMKKEMTFSVIPRSARQMTMMVPRMILRARREAMTLMKRPRKRYVYATGC